MSTLPAGDVASSVHRGPYSGLDGAHAVVHDFCRARGRDLAGPRCEVYGHGDEEPPQTTVRYLLRTR